MAVPDIAISVGVRDLTKAGLDGVEGSFGRLGRVGGAALGALKVAAVGAGVAVAGLGAVGVREFGAFLDKADGLDKMSQRLGISVEELSKLSFAAEQSGTDLATLETGYSRFARVIDDANSGSKTAIETLDKLGLSAEQLGALTPEQQILALADAFQQNIEPGDRLNLAQEALGRSGAQLLPLLQGGTTALDAYARQAEATGNVMSTQAATAGAAFNDSWNVIKNSISGVFLQISTALLPVFQTLVDFIQSTIIPAIQSFVGSLSGSAGLQSATEGVAGGFTDGLQPALDTIIQIARNLLVPAFEGVIKTLRVLWDVLSATVIPVITTVAGALRGLTTATGEGGAKLQGFAETMAIVGTAIGVLVVAYQAAMTAIKIATATNPLGLTLVALTTLGVLAYQFRDEIVGIFKDGWESIKGVFSAAGRFLAPVTDGIAASFKKIPNAFIAGLNAVIRAWNDFSISTPAVTLLGQTVIPAVNFQTPNIPTIPLLASGGIATRPTLAVVGDVPEAIIPLTDSRARAALDGGRGVTRNFYFDFSGASFYGEADLEDRMIRAFKETIATGETRF